MEGDPCSTYRSTEMAPVGTVTEVSREPNGLVWFRLKLDNSNSTVELNNRDVSPERVWEIEPDFLDKFRASVFGDDDEEEGQLTLQEHRAEPDTSVPREEEDYDDDDHHNTDRKQSRDIAAENEEYSMDAYRSAIASKLEHITQRLEENNRDVDDFKRTMGQAIRELAGDLQRAYRGEPLEFTQRYVDRYDQAVHDEAASEFRGSASPSPSNKSKQEGGRQREKFDFDVESVEYNSIIRESPQLTDDEE